NLIVKNSDLRNSAARKSEIAGRDGVARLQSSARIDGGGSNAAAPSQQASPSRVQRIAAASRSPIEDHETGALRDRRDRNRCRFGDANDPAQREAVRERPRQLIDARRDENLRRKPG